MEDFTTVDACPELSVPSQDFWPIIIRICELARALTRRCKKGGAHRRRTLRRVGRTLHLRARMSAQHAGTVEQEYAPLQLAALWACIRLDWPCMISSHGENEVPDSCRLGVRGRSPGSGHATRHLGHRRLVAGRRRVWPWGSQGDGDRLRLAGTWL